MNKIGVIRDLLAEQPLPCVRLSSRRRTKQSSVG
jgi:hypothetical protein